MKSQRLNCIYGVHAVSAHLEQPQHGVKTAYLLDNKSNKRIQSIADLCRSLHIIVEWQSREKLDELAQDRNHQGVALILEQKKTEVYDEPFLKTHLVKLMEMSKNPLLLILDGVTDPHNLGACLRSAEAAGVDFVIVPKNNSAPLNAVAIKIASGAAEFVPLVRVTNLSRTMAWMQQLGIWIFGAAGEAATCYDHTDMTQPIALALGAEGKGLRRLTREYCDDLIRIPMIGKVSSLNVSVATGVLVFEALRQRQKNKSK